MKVPNYEDEAGRHDGYRLWIVEKWTVCQGQKLARVAILLDIMHRDYGSSILSCGCMGRKMEELEEVDADLEFDSFACLANHVQYPPFQSPFSFPRSGLPGEISFHVFHDIGCSMITF